GVLGGGHPGVDDEPHARRGARPALEAHEVGEAGVVDDRLQPASLADLAEAHPNGERREAELLLRFRAGHEEGEGDEREGGEDCERATRHDCHGYSSSRAGRGTTVVSTTTRSSRHAVPL